MSFVDLLLCDDYINLKFRLYIGIHETVYESSEKSFMLCFVKWGYVFSLDRDQTTIGFEFCMSN